MLGALRVHPVVGGSCVVFFGCADERQVLSAGHVIGATAEKVTVGIGFFVEPVRFTVAQHLADDPLVFGFGAVAKDHAVRLGEPGRFIHPGFQRCCQVALPKNHPPTSRGSMRTGCDRANWTKWGRDGAPGWQGGVSIRRQFMLRVWGCASWSSRAARPERHDNLVRLELAPRCRRYFFKSAVQLTTSVMAALGCS